MKQPCLLFFILLFAALIRLFLLNSFPTGISNDELHFVLNAKSVFLQFTDLARNGWNPLSLQTIPQEASSELTFLLAAPFIGSLPLSLFGASYFMFLFPNNYFSHLQNSSDTYQPQNSLNFCRCFCFKSMVCLC